MSTSFKGRGLRLTALGVLGALALTGCAGGGGTPAADTTPAETAPAETTPGATPGGETPAATQGTVTVWHYFTDANQVALMEKYAALAEAAHPGMTVENVMVPYDQLNSQLISAAGANTGPDVVIFNGAETATIALAGALAPLDSYWATFADAGEFPDSVIHKIDGTMYAAQGYVNLLGLWYNKDILDEIGVQPPTTVAELEDAMAKAVAAGHGGITLSGLPNSQGEWQGYPWLSSDGFTYENMDEAALTAGLTRVSNWVSEGWLPREAVSWDQTVPFQQFAAGNFAFAANGNWQQGTAAADAKFNYGVTMLPLGAGGQVYLGGEGAGIGAHSANKDLAWAYLESSYLSKEGNLAAAELVGSIPARADAAADPAVANNELLKPFADTIAKFGATYPAPQIPAAAVNDVQLAMGQAWSSVIGGQHSPADAAASAIRTVTPLLGQ